MPKNASLSDIYVSDSCSFFRLAIDANRCFTAAHVPNLRSWPICTPSFIYDLTSYKEPILAEKEGMVSLMKKKSESSGLRCTCRVRGNKKPLVSTVGAKNHLYAIITHKQFTV